MSQEHVERLEQIARAIASGNVSELSMRVPAEPDRDADLVVMRAANEIAALRAEIAELEAQLAEARRVTFDPAVLEQMNAMEAQLTATLANNQELREALVQMKVSIELDKFSESYPSQKSFALGKLNEALATKPDDSALQRHVLRKQAKMLMDMAAVPISAGNVYGPVDLYRKAAELLKEAEK